jgi:endonuclease G
MKLDTQFNRRLRSELEERMRSGALPEAMTQWLDEQDPQPSRVPVAPHAFALPAATGPAVRIQTVVNAFESPSLLVRNHSFERPVSDTWQALLEPHRPGLEAVLPAVGRIEVDHHPDATWLGTGVLVAPRVVATNRHVALRMAEEAAEGWTWAPGTGDRPITARIDFREEEGISASEEFSLVDVLAVENSDGPDLAFLRVEERPGLPEPIPLGGAQAPNDAVAAVGYTGRETGLIPEVEEILQDIFGTLYDVKRFAPGRVLSANSSRLTHDCSTQQGNSGSAVLDIETTLLAGVHYEGGLSENSAVTAAVLGDRLGRLP